jgi:hypothetical protein
VSTESTEPGTGSRDPDPSAEPLEFESFFERGALGEYEDGPARVLAQQTRVEAEVTPLFTSEQLARRARLRRGVTVLVTALGLGSLVLFATRGARSPASHPMGWADSERLAVPAKVVSMSLGAARSEPVPPGTAPQGGPGQSVAPQVPAPAPVLALPPPKATASIAAVPKSGPLGGSKGGTRAAVPVSEPPHRSVPLSRAASAPARVALAHPNWAAEPSSTASFPLDPQ